MDDSNKIEQSSILPYESDFTITYPFEIEETNDRMRLIKHIIEISQKHSMILYGGAIRSIISGEEPNDLDFCTVESSDEEEFLDELEDHYEIDRIEISNNTYNHTCKSYTVTNDQNIEIKVDISKKKNIEKNSDCDVNALCLISDNTLDVIPSEKDSVNLFDAIDNMKAKRFRIINLPRKIPDRFGSDGIIVNSEYVVKYIKLEGRVTKLMGKGWTCETDIKEHFKPCHITRTTTKCTMCKKEDHRYSFKAKCCKKQFCFDCVLKYVKDKFHEKRISCPDCPNNDAFKLKCFKKKYTVTK